MYAWQATVQNEEGQAVVNPKVTVYLSDGSTIANIFNKNGTEKENPFLGNTEGFSQFWANSGNYRVKAETGSEITPVWDISLVGDFVVPNTQVYRPFHQRARDTVSALDLMSSGGLDGAVRNREATTSDAAEITNLFQELADDCALRSWGLSVPSGLYHLNKRIEASRLFPIHGEGSDSSVLRWTNGAESEGIYLRSGTTPVSRRTADLRFISLETAKLGTGEAAFTVDCSEQISGGVITPRAQTVSHVMGVKIKGSDLYTLNGWNKGIDFISCIGAHVTDSRIWGYVPVNGQLPPSERGLFFGGLGDPTQLTVSGTYISGFQVAARIEESEGVYFSGGCEFVNVGIGVSVFSAGIQPAFEFSGGHVAAHQKCIELTYATEAKILNNVFYPYQGISTPFIGIEINDGCYATDVTGNSFNRPTTATPYTCVKVNGGDYAKIDLNQFMPGSTSGCVAIDVAAAATNTLIGEMNAYRNANQRILNASTSTYAREWPAAYVASLDAIPTSSVMRGQRHICGPGATGGPGALASLTGCVVETTAYDTNAAVQVLRSPATNNWFQRRKSGGNWTAWITYNPGT